MTGKRTVTTDAWADFRQSVLRDAERYIHYRHREGGRPMPRFVELGYAYLSCQGLQASVLYRVSRLARAYRGQRRHRVFTAAVSLVYPFMARLHDIVTGISIAPSTEIGAGLYIAHFGGVVIVAERIGENCNIGHGVTVGGDGRTTPRPVIGDRVLLATGAKLLGEISVGDDCVVGANTVLTHSVPDRAVVRGNPGQVISSKGSFDLVHYRDADSDPARLASLAVCGPRIEKEPDPQGQNRTGDLFA